jgi:hypothetical protein
MISLSADSIDEDRKGTVPTWFLTLDGVGQTVELYGKEKQVRAPARFLRRSIVKIARLAVAVNAVTPVSGNPLRVRDNPQVTVGHVFGKVVPE